MQRDLVTQEKTAWLNYRGYCLFRRAGNRAPGGSLGVFLGDDYSRDLWRAWMERRSQLLVARRRRRS